MHLSHLGTLWPIGHSQNSPFSLPLRLQSGFARSHWPRWTIFRGFFGTSNGFGKQWSQHSLKCWKTENDIGRWRETNSLLFTHQQDEMSTWPPLPASAALIADSKCISLTLETVCHPLQRKLKLFNAKSRTQVNLVPKLDSKTRRNIIFKISA